MSQRQPHCATRFPKAPAPALSVQVRDDQFRHFFTAICDIEEAHASYLTDPPLNNSQPMWKLLIIVAKSALALLSAAGVGLLMFAVWMVWHYEYGIGLPAEVKLATVSATAPI